MNKKYGMRFLILLILLAFTTSCVQATVRHDFPNVHIDVIGDDGNLFPMHEVQRQRSGSTYRAYLEAQYQQNYAIRVHNRSS